MSIKVSDLKMLMLGSLLVASISMGVTATQSAFNHTATSNMTASSATLSIQGEGTSRVNSAGKTVTDMISTQKLVPNAVTSNSYKVTNSGNLRMNYTISTASASITPSNVAQRAQVTIKAGSTVLYTGSLATISTPNRTLNAGQSETLTIDT